MALYSIQLNKLPAQSFGVVLGDQDCRIDLYIRGDQLYFDLQKNNEYLYKGVLCLDRANLTPFKYRGFEGKLYFVDLEGQDAPDYKQFNERFVLIYEL